MKANQGFVKSAVGIAFVLLLVALTAYKSAQNEERRGRFRERNQEVRAAVALGREIGERVTMAFRESMSMRDFKGQCGSISPLKEVADADLAQMTHTFYHAPSQRFFYLRFEDGVLKGSRSNHGSADIKTTIVLESRAYLLGESVRKTILRICILLWPVVLIAGLAVRQLRSTAPVLLVVLAGLCGLC